MKLNKLTRKQFEKLYHNNKDLQQRIFDRMLDDCDFWVNEYLHGTNNVFNHYDFSYCGNGYADITDDYRYVNDLVEWVEKTHKAFDLWYNKKIEKFDFVDGVKYYASLVKRLNDLWCYTNISETNVKRLEERINDLKDEIESVIVGVIQRNYEFNSDDKIECGYEYLEDLFGDNAYVKGNIIYEPTIHQYC